ncbi:MAG: clostripain-related cysteine peptidase [bacterium]
MKLIIRTKTSLILALIASLLISCENNEFTEPTHIDHTLFVYMPWANDLTSCFETNISDLESALKQKSDNDVRVVVFFADSENSASLYELRYVNKKVQQTDFTTYDVGTFVTSQGIASLIEDVRYYAPSDRYSMAIGAHGTGWIPVNRTSSSAADETGEYAPQYMPEKMHYEYKDGALTRYFGGGTAAYQIDITEFADGLKLADIQMEYIVFDDCYMANIEVAYDLREVTNHIIASPTEIMAFGFPYGEVGTYLLGDINYEAIVNRFLDFYSTYVYPYATIGVIDCSELENMAEIMLEINSDSGSTEPNTDNIQTMDGYSPTIFFDYGDYVSQLCTDTELLSQFQTSLDKLVIYKGCTSQYYSAIVGGAININSYSGITTSQPTEHYVSAYYINTNWYEDTHN